MDVMRASTSIDELIEKRAREKSPVNELEAMYRESCRRHQEKQRRANRMAQSHALMSEDYQCRAEQLLEEPGGGG